MTGLVFEPRKTERLAANVRPVFGRSLVARQAPFALSYDPRKTERLAVNVRPVFGRSLVARQALFAL